LNLLNQAEFDDDDDDDEEDAEDLDEINNDFTENYNSEDFDESLNI